MSDVSEPVIRLKKLSKIYGHGETVTVALDSVSLDIEKGEFVAVMGPSGCGKTTLLNTLALLDTPTHGEYHLDGTHVKNISGGKRANIRRNQIGLVFQSYNLVPRLNIIENVALPLTYRGMSKTKRLKAASELLHTFGLEQREYYMPHQLSGGQLQRVAMARALVNNPSIILADEPTGNLDSKASEIIMNELKQMHDVGNTIVFVTHNPELTAYADRIIHMMDGKIFSDSKHPEPEPDPLDKRSLGRPAIKKSTKKVANKSNAKTTKKKPAKKTTSLRRRANKTTTSKKTTKTKKKGTS